MEKSSVISKKIRETYLAGATPHVTSNPVIRYEDGQLYLAVYAFFYTKEFNEEKKIQRPKNYALLDFDTGEQIKSNNCKAHDFVISDTRYNKFYDASDATKASEEEMEEAFSHLDKARELIKKSDDGFKIEYQKYMDVILKHTPKEYQCFYKDLSVIENKKKTQKTTIHIPTPSEAVNGRGRRAQRDASEPVDVKAKANEAFMKVFGQENKRKINSEQNKSDEDMPDAIPDDIPEEIPSEIPMEIDQQRMMHLIYDNENTRSEDTNQKTTEGEYEKKDIYTYQDLRWKPNQDLSQLPERYYQILKRISDKIEFLPCKEPAIRFEFPEFCFKRDNNPGVDPWMMMQAKILNRDLPKAHFKQKLNSRLYVPSCGNDDKCMFKTCPYVIAAYIKYLTLTNPEELKIQRQKYESQKEEVDAEGNPGYLIYRTEIKKKFNVREVKKAKEFINGGYFNMSRKLGTANIYVVTYTSDQDQNPMQNTKTITSFSITKEQIEQGISDGDVRRGDNIPIPKGVDVLIFTDYLMRTGQIVEMIPKKKLGDLIVLDF